VSNSKAADVRRPSRPPSAHIVEEDVEGIDPRLRALRRFVVWEWRWRSPKAPKKGKCKWDKPPIDPESGREIDATDPDNWLTFDQARRAARKRGDGIGFALGPEDNRLGIVGSDFDKCIGPDGAIDPDVMCDVRSLDSYTERTPSGTGLRTLVWGTKPGGKCKDTRRGIELYQSGRYFTLTGRHLEGTPTTIERRDEALAAFYDRLFGTPRPKASAAAGVAANGHAAASDDELIERARRAKNGAKFAALFDRGDTPSYADDESSADQALANMLAFWLGKDAARMEAAFGKSALGKRDKWIGRDDYRKRTIDEAIAGCREVYSPTHPPGGNGRVATATAGDDRHPVEITTRRHLALEETLKALVRDRDLYCRGDSLGIVIREEGDTAQLPGGVELIHAAGNMRFVPIAPAVLGCRLTRLASFFRWKPDKSGEFTAEDCHPPDWLIAAVAEHCYWPGVSRLVSITECPYVRADGSIAAPGFDRAIGALYRPTIKLPAIPARPTKKDVLDALLLLGELVCQFPFESGFDRDVWLADLFTCIQRPVIAGPVPGFVYNGNAAGVGKGLLIDLIGIIAHGASVGTRTYPADPKEAEKVKLTLALSAVPIVHFDNVPEGGFYGGEVMDSMLTSTVTSGRILGFTRDSGSVPLRPSWHISGNNISPTKDSGRRWLPSNLKTALEKPYERDDLDEENLRDHALKNRPGLLRAALIILRAHAQAGRPRGEQDGKPWAPLGSFEEWDRIVRGAVHFATDNDCLHTQRKGEEDRPDRLDKAALLAGWLEIDPGRDGRTIEEALDAVTKTPDIYPTLRAALLALGRDGKLPGVDKLKYKLRAMKNTPINIPATEDTPSRRMRFETGDEARSSRNGGRLWKVVAC
jgi:primase-polymerase (primpol)-like protein